MQASRSPRTGAEVVREPTRTVAGPGGGSLGLGLALSLASSGAGCSADPIEIDGQYGRPLSLATGSGVALPRLAFIDEGCPGEVAVGGCEAAGDRRCQVLLIDSLAPLTALRDPNAAGTRLSLECLEVRPAAGVFTEPDADADGDARTRYQQALDAAVARFRFDRLPLVRAPDGNGWSWTAGNQAGVIEPAGVLGGNLLRNFALAIRSPRAADEASVTFFGEFPGSEAILADQGRAFLPVQFPGRLLGRDPTDRCEVDEGRCELDGFDFSTSSAELPLQASRMVMDACLAIPPCTLRYRSSSSAPYAPGRCSLERSPTLELDEACIEPTDPRLGGLSASLLVATGVPGLVLFSDSATRMFGALSELPPCPMPLSPTTETDPDLRACLVGDDGVLHFVGWPSAGQEVPLTRLRIRSLAVVPGAARSRAQGPCERASDRRDAMLDQCERYLEDAGHTGDIRDAAPPYSGLRDDADGVDHDRDPGASALAVLGEPMLEPGSTGPRPARWISTTVLPADHPLALAVRRDVSPFALELDGLVGTALFPGTETVLDYTDLNPALRVSCLQPHDGRCQVLPDCREDRRPACCHGLPRPLLDELIRTLDDDTCCGAVSASDLGELQQAGHCLGVLPP